MAVKSAKRKTRTKKTIFVIMPFGETPTRKRIGYHKD
jgi:hypothetical protein